jgi:hypothetical protein
MPTVSGIIVSTGTEASGRRTLRDITDELARPIDASDTTVRALAGDAFRAAVRTMNRKGLWPWELQDEEITMTVDSPFSTVSGAIKKQLAMHYLDAAAGKPYQKIGYVSYDRFVERYAINDSGQPQEYTIPNFFETGQIRWSMIPGTAYPCKFSYYRVTPIPRSEEEPVEIPEFPIETYMSFAWYEFAKRLPAMQARLPLNVALAEARLAFREISSHVASPGDRSREV